MFLIFIYLLSEENTEEEQHMRKIKTTLIITISMVMMLTLNVFADTTGGAGATFDKNRVYSEWFHSKDGYTLKFQIQSSSNNYFIDWGCSIRKIDSGYISVKGSTNSYIYSDTIGSKLYVEQYVNGNWKTVKTFSDSLNNSDEINRSHGLAVESNSYYRVRSVNYIVKDGVKYTESSVTDSIYVN